MLGALMVDKLGRRTLFIISNVGMLLGMCLDRIGTRSFIEYPSDFGVWTLTTALFNALDDVKAAKGWFPDDSFNVPSFMMSFPSHHPVHLHLLLLLRYRLHADAHRIHPGNSAIQYQSKRFCGHGQLSQKDMESAAIY